MNKLLSTVAIIALGFVALAVASPHIVAVLNALVPLVVVGGLTAAVLRVFWIYTRRW